MQRRERGEERRGKKKFGVTRAFQPLRVTEPTAFICNLGVTTLVFSTTMSRKRPVQLLCCNILCNNLSYPSR